MTVVTPLESPKVILAAAAGKPAGVVIVPAATVNALVPGPRDTSPAPATPVHVLGVVIARGAQPAVDTYTCQSVTNASSAIFMFLISLFAAELYPLILYWENCGIAIAARMPMIATTIRSSIIHP